MGDLYRGADFHDHLNAPRGDGRLHDWPHAGAAGGAACGDLVRLAVRVEGERVVEAGFSASGCGALSAAASAAVELVEGALFLDAARVGPDELSDALGGLVPSKRHAAELAADALHRALGAAARAGAAAIEPSAGRTLVAMSGGVDSAVAAQLALEAGHEVVAVTLELWADPANDGERSCCSPQAVTGARALAHRMGLPHVTLDLREPFRRQVVEDFMTEYAAGRTPNPCVRCNGLVRFDAMLELAERLGAARLATGHYARVGRDEHGPLLQAAADPRKDQTYMLARLSPHELERLWFPLGELEKHEVRELARARRPAGGGEGREPGPLLPGGHPARELPPPPRRRPAHSRRDRRPAGQRARPPRRSAGVHGRAAPRPGRRGARAALRAAQGRRERAGDGRPAGRARHDQRGVEGAELLRARRPWWTGEAALPRGPAACRLEGDLPAGRQNGYGSRLPSPWTAPLPGRPRALMTTGNP